MGARSTPIDALTSLAFKAKRLLCEEQAFFFADLRLFV